MDGGKQEPWKTAVGCGSFGTKGRRPADWHDVPPGAVAIEPAEGHAMTAQPGQTLRRGVQSGGPRRGPQVWAVALPVWSVTRATPGRANRCVRSAAFRRKER